MESCIRGITPAFSSTKYLGQFCFNDRSPHYRSTQSRVWVLPWVSSLEQQLIFRFMKCPFLPLALLETSGFTNHQQLVLLLDFYFRGVITSRIFQGSLYLSLICYSSSRSSSSLVAVTLENHHYLIWKTTPTRFSRLQYSDNLSTCSTIEIFSLSLQARKLVRGLIPLDMGTSLKSQFQPFEHLIRSATFQIVFGASILNHLTLPNYHVVNKTCMSDVRNIHRPCSRFSTLSGALRT